jgi:hypothetical protein
MDPGPYESFADDPPGTALNSTDSPLLRLPAELRNKIYAYAVGGYVIYVLDLRWGDPLVTPEIRLCLSKLFRLSGPLIRTPRDETAYRDGSEESTHRSLHKCKVVSKIQNLSLVCRQIAAESSLFPFKYNTFKFDGQQTLEAFAQRLSLPQLCAVQTIGVELSSAFEELVYWNLKQILFDLPSLRRIMLTSRDHETRSARLAYLERCLSKRKNTGIEDRCIDLVYTGPLGG